MSIGPRTAAANLSAGSGNSGQGNSSAGDKNAAAPLSGGRNVAQELDAIVGYIRSAKREIAALCPEDIREKHIREATDELDAIVAHTEEATGGILDAAEAIENIAAGVGGETGEKLTEAVTKIYEACNFQDITGQRIGKVVSTLKNIEARLSSLASALGSVSGPPAAGAAPARGKQDSRPDAHLLNGPQLPQSAKKQDEIDALLKNFR